MGMKDRAIQIAYELKDVFSRQVSKITGGMRKIDKASDKSATQIQANNKRISSSYSKIATSIGPLKIAVLAAGSAIAGLLTKIQEWTTAANIQERADRKLETSLVNLTGATQEQIQTLKDQAATLQETTGYEDAAIISAQAMLATFKLTADQIEQLTPRLLDTAEAARVMGRDSVDLEAIAKALGKTFTSGAGGLAEYGVAMSDTQKKAFNMADQAGKVALLVKVLDENYQGLAESVGGIYEGAQRKAAAAQQDAAESLGTLFTKSKSWIGLSQSIAKSWKAIAKGITDSTDAIRPVISTFVVAGTAISSSIRITWNAVQAAWRSLAIGLVDSTALISSALSKITFGEVSEGFKRNTERLIRQSRAMKDNVGEDIADIIEANNDFVESLHNFGKKSDDAVPKVKSLSASLHDQKQALKEAREEAATTKKSYDDLVKTMNGVSEAPTVLDVLAAITEAQKALNSGDVDAAAQAAERGKELLVSMKQAGNETNTMLGYLAGKLAKVGKAAADASTADESLALDNTKKQLDELIAKKQSLANSPANINVTLNDVAKIKAEIESLTRPGHKTIYVTYVETNSPGNGGGSGGDLKKEIRREAVQRGNPQ